MKNILKNKWITIGIVLILGIVIGNFMGGGNSSNEETATHERDEVKAEIWTCSMHPQIQQDGPGQCPLCGMDLIPLDNSMDSEEALPDEVPMSDAAMKLAEIQTYVVKLEKPEKEIRLLGKVKPDERLMYSQTAHFPGRIEKLFINFTGEKVYKGQKLASIYSTELITAQKELFEVLKNESTSPALVDAARNKLKQWKFTDNQIARIEESGKVQTEIDILSNYNGYVMMRMVSEGDHVKMGQKLFKVVDLSRVWLLFEAYENDLPWVKLGDELSIELKSVPGEIFKGKVAFIDPFINPKTRVAYVRVEMNNAKGLLKPDMFANGIITSKLPIKEEVILVPKSAVLWTGKRGVVYVKIPNREHNSFIYREVILGEDAGDFYIIKKGLEEGEEIATNGVFKIDAAAQLAGKKSMMNPTGGKVSTGHDHSGGDEKEMEMSGMNMEKEVMIDKSKISLKFKKQLGAVVDSYLVLKDKLTKDDANIQTTVKATQKALENADMSLVMGDAHNVWMKALKFMNKDLKLLFKAVNIDEQRTIFLTISNSLSNAIQKLGIKMKDDKPLYLEFCQMANDNNGGYWLSTEKEIKNPYFGAKMLKCGEVKQQIK
ncbi:MAG: efflux RND transporter periplasmic adaptor subunit [Flavobacteriales bacterium]|nr:efflux RND transporter periplasmic adaptor subunit [Flavobacteriales bacterium]